MGTRCCPSPGFSPHFSNDDALLDAQSRSILVFIAVSCTLRARTLAYLLLLGNTVLKKSYCGKGIGITAKILTRILISGHSEDTPSRLAKKHPHQTLCSFKIFYHPRIH
ncbi:MAG: hypothetical protein LBF22_05840 [Deltaproteobacteria bacterium]|nr:hypothetical protein [Deltaproteobacteria bacterium]